MSDIRTTTQDVPATLIPYGDSVVIPEGTRVTITHRLGGNFTVTWQGGMAQIRGEHAGAIGEEVSEEKQSAAEHHGGAPEKEALWEALKKVYDPEIPVNIVDLGLIYSLNVEEQDGAYKVLVDMTLTAPGCGMGPAIAQDAKYRLEQVPGVEDAEVSIVWDPPWNQDMISEDGKMELGLL